MYRLLKNGVRCGRGRTERQGVDGIPCAREKWRQDLSFRFRSAIFNFEFRVSKFGVLVFGFWFLGLGFGFSNFNFNFDFEL